MDSRSGKHIRLGESSGVVLGATLADTTRQRCGRVPPGVYQTLIAQLLGAEALAKETSTPLRTTEGTENTEEHNIVAIGHDEPKATGPETLVRVNRQPSMTAVSLLRTLCPLCSLWLATTCRPFLNVIVRQPASFPPSTLLSGQLLRGKGTGRVTLRGSDPQDGLTASSQGA